MILPYLVVVGMVSLLGDCMHCLKQKAHNSRLFLSILIKCLITVVIEREIPAHFYIIWLLTFCTNDPKVL